MPRDINSNASPTVRVNPREDSRGSSARGSNNTVEVEQRGSRDSSDVVDRSASSDSQSRNRGQSQQQQRQSQADAARAQREAEAAAAAARKAKEDESKRRQDEYNRRKESIQQSLASSVRNAMAASGLNPTSRPSDQQAETKENNASTQGRVSRISGNNVAVSSAPGIDDNVGSRDVQEGENQLSGRQVSQVSADQVMQDEPVAESYKANRRQSDIQSRGNEGQRSRQATTAGNAQRTEDTTRRQSDAREMPNEGFQNAMPQSAVPRNERVDSPQEPRVPTREAYRNYVNSTNQMLEEKAQANGIHTESREYAQQVTGEAPPLYDEDVLWNQGYEVTGKKRNKWERIVERGESSRYRKSFLNIKESRGDISFDANEPETTFLTKLRKARNQMKMRYLNPSLVHIAGERFETHTEKVSRKVNGKKVEEEHTYARRVYSERIQYAINEIQNIYDCSISDVLRLIQLRAGLGIDVNGTIASVDPKEFKLTEDQAFEIMRDICDSQRENGHPLGPVRGKPGGSGVRDDTGKFVVVAGTRCFSLGYMPKDLINSLSRNWGSALHGLSERQIQKMIADTWINETYPQLCANTGGNLMHQARAIENMVRAMASIDGVNSSALGIPKVTERKTLMQMRAEQASTEDDAIREANEVKHNRIQAALNAWTSRYQKSGTTRNSDGSISSWSKRRRNKGGDAFRTLSNLERASKAANIMVMVSSVPEAFIARREQSLANWLSETAFRSMHENVASRYSVTDRLSLVASTKEAVDALTVAESLYRIGGHTAIDAFFAEMDDSGHYMNRLTKADLREFLRRWGVAGDSITDELRDRMGLKTPGEIAGFLSNLSAVLDGAMLGSGMFRDGESQQFVRMSMAEMARASVHGRESYTNGQVEQWADRGGGEEMIRSLLQTDAGREAFMTQGITSLARKSPVEHMMRRLMAKNGLTEFAVRTMFDRFPEYGVNKVLEMMPMSNTLSFLASRGISSVGDVLAQAGREAPSNVVSNAAQSIGDRMLRTRDYQAGGRLSFAEGFRKNLMYDCVMGGEKILIAGIYAAVIAALGGLQPPDDDRDRYNWSEWKIGSGDDAIPIKWAWWMDDLSGIGLPLGMAWAICEQGGWSDEAKSTATNTFINAVANLNSGTAVFDFIDLVNNFDQEVDAALDTQGGYEPSRDEWLMTAIEQGFWDMVGDLTPTFVGQLLVPWSKDFIVRGGDQDAHTASKVYDTSRKSKSEAEEEQKTQRTGSYSDYMRRRATQTNILYAMFMDWITGAGDDESDLTGYKYTEQPLDTMVDPYAQKMFDRFFLDLDPATTDIPPGLSEEDRAAELDERAEDVVQWIDDHYTNATQAALDGFVLNYDARVNCINYCHKMINKAWENYYSSLNNGWLDDDDYQAVLQTRKDAIDHYNNLIYNYFQSDEIGWSLPRYVRQESDRETRYVDSQGNPMTYLDTLPTSVQRIADSVMNPLMRSLELGDRGTIGNRALEESYWYGNRNNILPFYSPIEEGKGRNYETIPYNIVLDEDGNPVNDVGAMYDNAATMDPITMGRLEGKDVQELMWGGQGNNLKDDVSEELAIPREGVPTLGGSGGSGGGRPWRLLESSVPEELGLGSLDADAVSERLGIPASLPTDGKYAAQSAHDAEQASNASGGGSGYRGGYNYSSGGGSYYYSGGGGGYSSAYNPRIYSNARQVNSDRASGMRTYAPYKPTTTYLRPSFYTKGSREAYKRSDL